MRCLFLEVISVRRSERGEGQQNALPPKRQRRCSASPVAGSKEFINCRRTVRGRVCKCIDGQNDLTTLLTAKKLGSSAPLFAKRQFVTQENQDLSPELKIIIEPKSGIHETGSDSHKAVTSPWTESGTSLVA